MIPLLCLNVSAQSAGTQLLRNNVPAAIGRFHLQPLGELPATNRLHLAIGLPLRDENTLDQWLQQIYDPASPNFHHYLTPEEFTEQFGPSPADYDAIVAFARGNGLEVTSTCSNRTLVDVKGDVRTIEKVFHTKLQTYRHPREHRNFFAPDREPSIDSDVPVSHISGLDNYVIPKPAIRKKAVITGNTAVPSASGSGPSGLYMGNDFRLAYVPNVAAHGAGQTVALFEMDGYYPGDIAAYAAQAGLPAVALTNIYIDGFNGAPGDGNGEVALDIEMIMSLATNLSRIIVYQEANPGIVVDELNRIANDNLAKQISSSWMLGNDPSYDTVYKQMAAQGQSFFQASGDDDAYYPGITQWADDTNITLVGGTTLFMNGAGGSYSSEQAWNWGTGSGTGGGTNLNGVLIPSWQSGISMAANQGSTTLRNVPDVAMTADNIFIVADNGVQESVGGTSAAAPLWAAYTALVNQQAALMGASPVGFLNPAIYSIGKGANYTANFHDVTAGNNTNSQSLTKYFAVSGYDLCTGWGSPNGQALINSLVAPDSLLLFSPDGIFSAGPKGGPFSPSSQTFLLTNTTAASLPWSLMNTSAWLTASASSGTLSPNGTATVQLSVTTAANALAVGSYSTTVRFSNSVTHVVQRLPARLVVQDPLTVSPSAITVVGPVGGPFLLTSPAYTLNNTGVSSLNWRVANTSSWFTVSPTSGTLAAGTQVNVAPSPTTAATALAAGNYSATLYFTNQTISDVLPVSLNLTIGQNIVQNPGFETGSFANWILDEGTNIYSGVDNGSTVGFPPHSGTYLAGLGHPTTLGYLSQTLTTAPGQAYLVSLWLNSPDRSTASPPGNTPNEFNVSWNGTVLADYVNLPPLGWTNLQFTVMATGSSSELQFGERVDPWYLGLDDVSVVPIAPTVVQALARTNNTIRFSWNALTGLVYQVQFKTNLLQTNWTLLRSITATNKAMTFTDTNLPAGPRQKYYRLQLP